MSLTLAELAIHIHGSIDLFEKHELDYYQNGKQTLEEACKRKDLDFSKINIELNLLQDHSNQHINMEDLGVERLMDFINVKYHSKEKSALSNIHTNIQKVLKDKNNDQAFVDFVENIEEIFRALMDNFIRHCNKEDKVLFPYIKKLVELRANKTKLSSHHISLLKNPIRILESEHEKAVGMLLDIKKWMNECNLPKNASVAYVSLIEDMKEFEKDLHMHLHLENNILFPKCIAIEEELKRRIE